MHCSAALSIVFLGTGEHMTGCLVKLDEDVLDRKPPLSPWYTADGNILANT